MRLTIKGCNFNRNGTGISVPHDTVLDLENISFDDNGTALIQREAPTLLQQLGLPSNTDPEIVIEALAILQRVKTLDQPMQIEALRESKMVKMLGVGADIVTIAGILLPFLPK
ncbi:hypothetical protein [Janthinobacterium sp. P210005]|uniref:hypothetical protein n=1 Tax=Janthinobacterium sp. P210005 TaxID=3112938 RepID=UPI002E2583B9|nr:hypothetical protein [Janthinobacterium sp. P210005]